MHPQVFVSYSHRHEDDHEEKDLQRLQTFLHPLERNGVLAWWSDHKLQASDDWKAEINRALARANVAVLLISPDFLASEFIVNDELPLILAREAAGELKVIPVFLSPSSVRDVEIAFTGPQGESKTVKLSKFQGRGTPEKTLADLSWPDRDRQYEKLTQELVALTGSSTLVGSARPRRGGAPVVEPRQEKSYPLIVDFELRDQTLEARARLPGLDDVICGRQLPWSAVCADLDALERQLEGDREALRHLVSPRDGTFGDRLFWLLFGEEHEWRPVMRRVFGQDDSRQPNPSWGAVRLIVHTELDRLAHLPWRLVRFRGRLLVESGWRIVTAFDEPEGDLHTSPPANVLIVASHEASDHREALREIFAKIWPTGREQRHLSFAATRQQLEEALRSKPHLLYVCGEGTVDSGHAVVFLDRADKEGRDPLRLDELAALCARSGRHPQVIVLNVTGWTAVPEPSPARLFAPQVPLIVWRRLSEFQPDSKSHILEWLRRWLGDGRDPVAALRPLRRPLPLTLETGTALVHASYGTWRTAVYRASALDSTARLRLDRVHQRALVRKYLAELARSDSQRVLTLVSYAAPGNALGTLWEQLRYELDLELDEVPVEWRHLLFPTARDDLRWSLEADLRAQLKATSGDALQDRLRRSGPKGAGVRRGILWLDWGTPGAAPEHGAELQGPQLAEWIRFASGLLCNECPADLRLVCHLGVTIDGERHDRFDEFLQRQRLEPGSRRPEYQLRPLPPLDVVTREDLFYYLEDPKSQCPPGIVEELVQRIMAETEGVFEPTVALLEEAERGSCYDLLERLRQQQGDGVEREIETW